MSARRSLYGSPIFVGAGGQQEESPTSVVDHPPPPADNPSTSDEHSSSSDEEDPPLIAVPPKKHFERVGQPFTLGGLKLQRLRYNPTAESIRDYPDFRTLDMVYNQSKQQTRAAGPNTRQHGRPPSQPRPNSRPKRSKSQMDKHESIGRWGRCRF